MYHHSRFASDSEQSLLIEAASQLSSRSRSLSQTGLKGALLCTRTGLRITGAAALGALQGAAEDPVDPVDDGGVRFCIWPDPFPEEAADEDVNMEVKVAVGAVVAVSEAGSVKLNAGRLGPFLAGESFNVEKKGGEI